MATAQFFIQQVGEENGDLTPEEVAQVQARDYQRLEAMTEYCKSTTCLRAHILDYFGQAHGERCGNCGPCRTQYAQVDITRPAQMLLSCVPRVKEKLGYYVGKGLLTRVLRGSRERRVLELGLDQVSTYGLMREVSPHQLRQYMDAIEAQGLWLVEPEHSTVRLTDRAKEVLFGGERVYLRQAAQPEPVPRPLLKGARPDEALAPEEAALMETLRSVRSRLAREENVPLYVVFSNATLADMARRRPRTMGEFLDVSGVGEKKAKKYGKAFLEAIAKGGE